MIQPSLSFLAMPIPAALKVVASFRSIEDLPEPLLDGVVDTIEALMGCFPEAAAIYHPLDDAQAEAVILHHLFPNDTKPAPEFDRMAEAHRLLAPAVEAAIYPLITDHGTMLADTPLTVALAPGSAMMLLQECVGRTENIHADAEWEALYEMTGRLLDGHPALKASIEQRFDDDEPDFDFFAEAYEGMVEANKTLAQQPQLEMAA